MHRFNKVLAGTVTHMEDMNGVLLDNEENPVATGAAAVDQLADVLLDLYALWSGRAPVRVPGQGANGIIESVEPPNAATGERSLIHS
jgi:hypothetical protein